MSVIINTAAPEALLKKIKKAIDDRIVETWEYDKDGDFTHTPTQRKNKAWLRPSVQSNVLRFELLPPQNTTPTKEVIGVYHGRFIEMLIAHFGNDFTRASAPQ